MFFHLEETFSMLWVDNSLSLGSDTNWLYRQKSMYNCCHLHGVCSPIFVISGSRQTVFKFYSNIWLHWKLGKMNSAITNKNNAKPSGSFFPPLLFHSLVYNLLCYTIVFHLNSLSNGFGDAPAKFLFWKANDNDHGYCAHKCSLRSVLLLDAYRNAEKLD